MAKLGTTGIDEAAVQGATGVYSSTDWSVLCCHPNINKWSRWKPIRSDKLELVDLDMASSDFGFDLRTNDQLSSVNPIDIFANRTWPYLPPRGGGVGPFDEVFRIADFRTYNSAAKSPFDFSIQGQNGYEGTGTGNIVVAILESTDENCEIHLADFTPLFDNICVWGVLYREHGAVTDPIYVGWQEGDAEPKTNPTSGMGEFVIPVDPGTYDVCLVINKTNDKLYLVPDSFRTVEVRIIPNEEFLKVSGYFGYRKEGTKNLYASLVLTNSDVATKSATYRSWIYAHNSAGVIVATLHERLDYLISLPVGTTAFPIGEEITGYGNEGFTRDEAGVGIGSSYSFLVQVIVEGFSGFPLEYIGTLNN